jgi:hypothetical protein
MRNNLKTFKARALARADVRREYDALAEEFELLDEILKARAAAGLTQAEVAAESVPPICGGAARIRHREAFIFYRNAKRYASASLPATATTR